jgi:hypothetical protein
LACCAVTRDGRTFVTGDDAGSLHIIDWIDPSRHGTAPVPARISPSHPLFAAPADNPIEPAPPLHPVEPAPMTFQHLPHDDITALHAAAVHIGLAASRDPRGAPEGRA